MGDVVPFRRKAKPTNVPETPPLTTMWCTGCGTQYDRVNPYDAFEPCPCGGTCFQSWPRTQTAGGEGPIAPHGFRLA